MSHGTSCSRDEPRVAAVALIERSRVHELIPEVPVWRPSRFAILHHMRRPVVIWIAMFTIVTLVLLITGYRGVWIVPALLGAAITLAEGRLARMSLKACRAEWQRDVNAYLFSTGGPTAIREGLERSTEDLLEAIDHVWTVNWVTEIVSFSPYGVGGRQFAASCHRTAVMSWLRRLLFLQDVQRALWAQLEDTTSSLESPAPWIEEWLAKNPDAPAQVREYMRLLKVAVDDAEPARAEERRKREEVRRRQAEEAARRREREEREAAERRAALAKMERACCEWITYLPPRDYEKERAQQCELSRLKLQLGIQINALKEVYPQMLQRGEFLQANAVRARIRELEQALGNPW